MNWKETWFLRKEPTEAQNAYMDFMSMCGFFTALIVSVSPLVAIVLLIIQFAK